MESNEDFDLLDRRKKYFVGQQQIRAMLHLPDEAQVKAVYSTVDPVGFCVVVVHPDFELVPPDAEAPPSFLTTRVISYNSWDGHVYERVELYDDDFAG